jgi:hypothetical protein
MPYTTCMPHTHLGIPKSINPARRPGGFAIRRKKKVRPIKTGGFAIPQQKEKHTPLLRIANPQSINRLGHFLTPDYKSGGTPSGLKFLKKRRRRRVCGGTGEKSFNIIR